jgi:hypothetical protein
MNRHLVDRHDFAECLAEAIAWCAVRGTLQDPARSLRSLELRPAYFRDEEYTVSGLVYARGQGLRAKRIPPADLRAEFGGGRLLVCRPHESTDDGAAEFASRGFFDVHNVPPWDTWLAYYKAEMTLVSWVPPEFIELAQGGIEVDPLGSLEWLTDQVEPLVTWLGAEGLWPT